MSKSNQSLNHELTIFSDNEFDLGFSVIQAHEDIRELLSMYPNSKVKFEHNIWSIFTGIKTITLNFNKFDQSQSPAIPKHFISIVKCWIIDLLQKIKPGTVPVYMLGFQRFFTLSKGFNHNTIEEIKIAVEEEFSTRSSATTIMAALNFIDYYKEIDNENVFMPLLIVLSEKIDRAELKNVRDLPPAKEVYIFNWVVSDFFNNKKYNEKEFIAFFPIWFWWSLTVIIPLRPSEFCDIARDALHQEKGQHYLRLPREKIRKDKVQIVDTIAIPEYLAEGIETYIDLTSESNFEQTGYLMLQGTFPSDEVEQPSIPRRYTYYHHWNRLHSFYREIVNKKYSLSIKMDSHLNLKRSDGVDLIQYDITHPITPGDTRHFSMLNLMRQGFHPLEIARLAGHQSLYTQRSYYGHLEYWADTEVMQLMEMMSAELETLNKGVIDVNDLDFKNKFVLSTTSETMIPLNFGYCTDPLQNCQTEECYQCQHWRLSPEDLENRQDEIVALFNQSKDKLHNLIIALANLQMKFFSEKGDTDIVFSDMDFLYNKELTEVKNQLDVAIRQHSKMAFTYNRLSVKRGGS